MSSKLIELATDFVSALDTSGAGRHRLIGRDDSTQDRRDGTIFDDERVVQLLSAHDGKMWQGEIVAETGWSESKTSRTLSAMEQDGKISRCRVGREKLVYLPGQAPTTVNALHE